MTRIVPALSRGIIAKIFSPFYYNVIVACVIRALYGAGVSVCRGRPKSRVHLLLDFSIVLPPLLFRCYLQSQAPLLHHDEGIESLQEETQKVGGRDCTSSTGRTFPSTTHGKFVRKLFIPELAIFAFCRYSVRCGALPPPFFRFSRRSPLYLGLVNPAKR